MMVIFLVSFRSLFVPVTFAQDVEPQVGLVTMILMRTLRKDYARYSKEDDMDDWRETWVTSTAGSRY